MKKVWDPAHTEYFLTLEKGSERLEYFNGCCYRTKAIAQKEADLMNARRKAGRVVVESKEREGQWSYETTLRF